VKGEQGDFNVRLTKRPRYIIEDKCTGCTTCVKYCPVSYPDAFNQEISENKAVHIYFSQAIPLVAYIDESCLFLKEKKCLICENVCQADAIDLTQEPETIDLNVGAVVLSLGMKPFDPSLKDDYGYGTMQNVVTSMDYERLLSSTGPYAGEVLRGSDQKHPQKVAWIQCVGSRRVTPGDNSYCSAVCCSYAQKQVILTKEHEPDSQCTIFHNDVRTHGKDFERYFQRAQDLEGVRFERSYATVVGENPETGNVTIRYSTFDEGVKEEEFDLVVLSVGLAPPVDVQDLAEVFGIELGPEGFCAIQPDNPIATSRPGVFVTGNFSGPTDIPESVFTASAASSQCGELLGLRRGKLSQERAYPPETDVSGEDPRVGVFVCHCGANIGSIVNVPSVVEYAKSLPNVVHAQEQLFSCATNSAMEITDTIKEKNLNRVVVAACSPRTLEPLFRDTLLEAGINQYYTEMANIREHNSWVHSKDKEGATDKAKDIVRMSVARSCFLEPLQEFDLPVNDSALVIGGGVAGMTCALSIAAQGHTVCLLEKEAELGGNARHLHYNLDGSDVEGYLKELISAVYKNPSVHVYHNAEIQDADGYIGNFSTTVKSDRGVTAIKHGATVIATGAAEYQPSEYLYGEDVKVLTQVELEEAIATDPEAFSEPRTIAMIQCVGCRNSDRNYCSRICCGHALKNALKLKQLNPENDVYIIYRDMASFGFIENHYREAAEQDVKFVRYDTEHAPSVEAVEEEGQELIRVGAHDPVLGMDIAIDAHRLALSAATVPAPDTERMAGLFKVTMSPDGFLKEAHAKLKPVEFATDGVYLCGMAQYPKYLAESIKQAYGAAGKVLTLLSKDTVTASGAVAAVDQDECISCGACITACTYGAIAFTDTPKGHKAIVNPVLCKGDGVCNTKCPTGAIKLKHFTDDEVLSQIDAAIPQATA